MSFVRSAPKTFYPMMISLTVFNPFTSTTKDQYVAKKSKQNQLHGCKWPLFAEKTIQCKMFADAKTSIVVSFLPI